MKILRLLMVGFFLSVGMAACVDEKEGAGAAKEANSQEKSAGVALDSEDDSSDAEPKKVVLPSQAECFDRGIEYYIEIGSYPYLSTGEDAAEVATDKCSRSPLAFGSTNSRF